MAKTAQPRDRMRIPLLPMYSSRNFARADPESFRLAAPCIHDPIGPGHSIFHSARELFIAGSATEE